MKSNTCKGCRFWKVSSRKCALTNGNRNAWECCPSHAAPAAQEQS